MNKEHYYEVSINWEEERKGMMTSPVLNSSIEAATPPEFPSGMAGIWSPEHLFVGAINSCLMTTFLAIAEHSKLEFSDFKSTATGKLEIIDGKYIMSEVILKPTLTIRREADKEKSIRILQKSEAACLITNSVKSKIIFQPEILVDEVAHS